MAAYFLFGKYTAGAVKGISAERTKKAEEIIKQNKGQVHSMHVLLGEHDLVMLVDFPNSHDALKTSISLTEMSGIAFSTSESIPVDSFDQLMA